MGAEFYDEELAHAVNYDEDELGTFRCVKHLLLLHN
jgi:hypothetical protein